MSLLVLYFYYFLYITMFLFYGQRLVLWLYIALIVLSLLAACLTFLLFPI